MELQIRKNKSVGIQTEDELVLHRRHADDVVLGTVVRGFFDERPQAPKTTHWTYRAELYEFERIYVVLIVEETKELQLVEGKTRSSIVKKERNLLSQNGGDTWMEVNKIMVGEARPFSTVSGG